MKRSGARPLRLLVLPAVLCAGPAVAALLPASGLTATPMSSSSIQLAWVDPNGDESGFRIERSTDGVSFSVAGNVNASTATFLDMGRPAATLIFYRVIAFTFSPAANAPPSNVAAAHTFPSAAVDLCSTPIGPFRPSARFPSIAHNGTQWAAVWSERSGGTDDEVYFQLLDQPTGAPVGQPKRLTTTDPGSFGPIIVWNGTHFGVSLFEIIRAEPGGPSTNPNLFLLLDGAGNTLRGNVVFLGEGISPQLIGGASQTSLTWHGTGWGFLAIHEKDGLGRLGYTRLTPEGDLAASTVFPTTSTDPEYQGTAVWNGTEYGLAWSVGRDSTSKLYFQRMNASGVLQGSPTLIRTKTDISFSLRNLNVVADGSGWVVAWQEPFLDNSTAVFLQRLDLTGALLGGNQRMSDDGVVVDQSPRLFKRSGGGFLAITLSNILGTNRQELARLTADATGARSGSRVFLTPDDMRNEGSPSVATDGTGYAAVFHDSAAGTLDFSSLVVDATGSVSAGPTAVTSGHFQGTNTGSLPSPGHTTIPFKSGFVTIWTDPESAASVNVAHMSAAIIDGAGTVTEKSPLTTRPIGRVAALPFGDTFAVATLSGGAIWFDRYDATGTSVLGDTNVVPSGINNGKGLSMAFSGAHFGAAYVTSTNQLRLSRFTAAGAAAGAAIDVGAVDSTVTNPLVQWTGKGWAILFTKSTVGQPNAFYAFVADDGSTPIVTIPGIQVTFAGVGMGGTQFLWNGAQHVVVRHENRGIDPPAQDVYFTAFGPDGFTLGPDVTLVSTSRNDSVVGLFWDGEHYHLLYAGGLESGLREVELMPDGTVLPGERFLTNRTDFGFSPAWNGVTIGLSFASRELFFMTSACLDDVTDPACPTGAAVAYDGMQVTLDWDAATPDPESGLHSYTVYRNGGLVSLNRPSNLSHTDGGAPRALHTYQVRALNGAFRESQGCALLQISTVHGDANGDGLLNVSDVLYLINHLFAGGPAPLGFANVNGDGSLNVGDILYLINHLFAGGPAPV